jgi:acyl-CoA thioester hydrolase
VSEERPRREEFPHLQPVPTRWNDNDVYGHVNNVEYLGYFDTAINHWLITEGGLDIQRGETVGFCVESHCAYHAPVSFPDELEAGLRVGHLGSSSVRYEIGIFKRGEPDAAAHGWFVHVFVDRDSSASAAIPPAVRTCLERLQPPEPAG